MREPARGHAPLVLAWKFEHGRFHLAGVGVEVIGEARPLLRAEISGIDPRYEPLTLYLDIKIWAALAVAPEDEGAS